MANGRDTSLFKPSPQQQQQHHHHHHQEQQQAKERKQQSNHLLLLQKEIKEEEEEIFADINSFINSSSNSLYFTYDNGHQEDDSRGCGEVLTTATASFLEDEEHQARVADKLCYFKSNSSRLNQFNFTSNIHHHHHLISSGNINGTSNNNSNSHNNLNNNNSIGGNTENTNPYLVSHKTSELYRRQQHLANDSDDLNDYQSHSADDTTINDYQSDSLAPHHLVGASAAHANNTIDDSQSDDRIDHHDLYQVDAGFIIPETAVETALQDDSQYIQDEQLEETGDDERSRSSSGTGHIRTNNNQQFSTDSEQAVFSEEERLNYQAIQAVIQQVQSNLPKPCVFFLEGNCRRSDCKYSHDLSNITCKYWIEGFCFKGEQCPFQHSYSIPNDSSLHDARGQILDPKQQVNPTFVIESEADFPSLPFDTPPMNDSGNKRGINVNPISTELEHQILSSNSAVVFKTVKKKRKRG